MNSVLFMYPSIKNFFGNRTLLSLHKTAFLCSRNIPASAVLKCYDWAMEQREQGNCVISCFQSKIEKDVLHFLLQGTQPVIIALARGLQKRMDPLLSEALACDRLLILSPFSNDITRVTAETAEKRNLFMLEIADEITFGYISKDGHLSKLLKQYENKKPIKILCE